jgi:hypothetical protein
MNEMIILGTILAGLWILILWLRVPASVAFFSLLVGQLLASEASSDVYEFISGVMSIPEARYVQIFLLVLPLFLTVLFMRGRVKKSQLPIELIPALFVALIRELLAVPFIPELQTIVDSVTKDQSEQYRSVVLLAAAVSGLFSAWMSYPKPHDKHGKHHKK